MDLGWILEGFWVTFGIIFRALYPMSFQERSKSDFGWILAPKTSKIEFLNFPGIVLEGILVPLGPQDGLQRPQQPSKKAQEAAKKASRSPPEVPRTLQEGPRGCQEGLMGAIFNDFGAQLNGFLLCLGAELINQSINSL